MGTMMSIDLEQRVRERAYEIWEREGRVHGRAEAHWHTAKLELAGALLPTNADEVIAVPVKKGRKKAVVEVAAPVAAPRRRRATGATLPN
jgi:hypothetical protein